MKSGRKPPRGKGTDYVYLALRDLIVRMDLPPGEKIDEAALSKELGVSRTPLREALVRLAADRLITISPNHGAHVTPLDAFGLTQYFEALELTHRALVHWACLRRTQEDLNRIEEGCTDYERVAKILDPVSMGDANLAFHHAIADAAKNEFLAEYVDKLSILGLRISWIWYRDFTHRDPDENVKRTIEEHREILAAIKERDVAKGERLARTHIQAFRDRVFAQFSISLGGEVPI